MVFPSFDRDWNWKESLSIGLEKFQRKDAGHRLYLMFTLSLEFSETHQTQANPCTWEIPYSSKDNGKYEKQNTTTNNNSIHSNKSGHESQLMTLRSKYSLGNLVTWHNAGGYMDPEMRDKAPQDCIHHY